MVMMKWWALCVGAVVMVGCTSSVEMPGEDDAEDMTSATQEDMRAEAPEDMGTTPRPGDMSSTSGEQDMAAVEDMSPPPPVDPCDDASISNTVLAPPALVAGRTSTVEITSDEGFVDVHLTLWRGGQEVARGAYVTSSGNDSDGFAWTFTLDSPQPPGADYCLRFETTTPARRVLAAQPVALGAPADLPAGVAYKLVEHHQDTCEENGFGVAVRVRVIDAAGAPLEGVPVAVRWDSEPTIGKNRWWTEDHQPPTMLVTGGDGWASFENKWPIWERYEGDELIDKDYQIFEISVADGASDTAGEVTTGYWEDVERDDGSRCSFCPPGSGQNVWGHWSYRIVFQRREDAAEVCRLNHDHAGQAACSPDEVYVTAREPSCQPL